MAPTFFKSLALLATINVVFACASKKTVRTEVGTVNTNVDTLSGTVEETQERTPRNEERIGTVDQKADAAGKGAPMAQASAVEAAPKRLIYTVTLSEDQGNFKFGKADLPDTAKARLDELINQLKVKPDNILIEIEGHTDNVGNKGLNKEIGLERAEEVKRYLYEQHQIPLHKINVISYGEEKPAAPNATRQGRAQNRRVVVNVLENNSVPAPSGSVEKSGVRASRVFAGPNQYPPRNFAAYGILAFRSKPTSQSRSRYEAICQGYLAAIPASSTLAARQVPLREQMATVWPLDDRQLADVLNASSDPQERCAEIVTKIDTITSDDAIAAARRSDMRAEFNGEGPFLLAWSPSAKFGEPQTVVLFLDLSNVTTPDEARNRFVEWKRQIEEDPQLWRNRWDLERLRTIVRQFADKYGPRILVALGLPDQ